MHNPEAERALRLFARRAIIASAGVVGFALIAGLAIISITAEVEILEHGRGGATGQVVACSISDPRPRELASCKHRSARLMDLVRNFEAGLTEATDELDTCIQRCGPISNRLGG
jgi:hypothetical protein